jgi:hypothetical protein
MTLRIMTLSITSLTIAIQNVTLNINYTQIHDN